MLWSRFVLLPGYCLTDRKEKMIKIIMIVSMLLLLNNCAGYGFYKNYKGNKLYKEQQKQLIEKQQSWLNIWKKKIKYNT